MSKIGSLLLLNTILLAGIGVFILYESSSYTSLLNIGDKYYFVKNQSVWMILGVISCLVISRFPYKKFYALSLPALLVSYFLLLLVFIPGLGLQLKGAHRWIDLGFMVLQPSEILKITLTLYLAAWLSFKEKGRLLAFLILVSVSVFLVIIEPDMGTAMIIGSTATIVYFLSGASTREMGIIGSLMVLAVVLLISVAPYRVSRLAAFRNFDANDLSTTSYHVKQMVIAVGSGGFAGVGLGNSTQKYAYLPENTTDSIFAIYAEETGFLGSTFLLGLFFTQLFLGLSIATRAKDQFGMLLASGIIIFITIQSLVNLASQVVLIPLTGVPLPFISYGGSSMIINFSAIGILLSISRDLKGPKHIKKL